MPWCVDKNGIYKEMIPIKEEYRGLPLEVSYNVTPHQTLKAV